MAENSSPAKLSRKLMPEEVWVKVKPLIPNLRTNKKTTTGRKPVPHRQVLSGILYVLRRGVSWEDLPVELGWGTGMTCWRRVRALQKAKVWNSVVRVLTEQLPDGRQIPFDRVDHFQSRGPRTKEPEFILSVSDRTRAPKKKVKKIVKAKKKA